MVNVKAANTGQIQLSQYSGNYNSAITVFGSHFSQYANITIKWSTLSYWNLRTTADQTGSFTISFSIPNGAPGGNSVISASDDNGNSDQKNFSLNYVYAKSTSFGITTPKQIVQWSNSNTGIYCSTWQTYVEETENWLTGIGGVGIYVLRLTYNGVPFIFDLNGGTYDAYPVPLIERITGVSSISSSQVQGNIQIYDPTGTIPLLKIIVDVYSPQIPDKYYSVIFTMIAQTKLDDLSLYAAYNLNMASSSGSFAQYEQTQDAVYQVFDPTQSNDPNACYIGFASVIPPSTHHDVTINSAYLQRIATNLADYNFNYIDRSLASGGSSGQIGMGLQWDSGSMNAGATSIIPIAFATSEGNLDNFNAIIFQSKELALQKIQPYQPSIIMSSNQGPGSSIINVSGNNFMRFSTVKLNFGGLSVAQFTADKTGAFQGSFCVPTYVTGTCSVTATDNFGLSAASQFTVVELTLQWLLNNLNQNNALITLLQANDNTLSAQISTSIGTIITQANQINATITGLVLNSNGNLTAKIDTLLGNTTATLNQLNATIVGLIKNSNDTLSAQISTSLGTVVAQVNQIDASITGLVLNSNGVLTAKMDTLLGSTSASLNQLSATLVGLIKNSNDTLSAQISTSLGTIVAQANQINATITGLVLNSNDTLTAKIDTLLGNTTATLNQLNATLVGLVKNSNDTLSAQISTSFGSLNVNINALNPILTALDGNTATIKTDIGVLQTNVTDINAHIQSLKGTLATVQTDYGVLQGTVVAIRGDVVEIKTGMGIIDVPKAGHTASLLLQPIVLIEIAAVCGIALTIVFLSKGTEGLGSKLRNLRGLQSLRSLKMKSKSSFSIPTHLLNKQSKVDEE